MAIEVKKVVAEGIGNGATKEIRAAITSNGNDDFLDLRNFENADNYKGPTKQGLWISYDALYRLVNEGVFEKALEIMDEMAAPKIK